MLKSVGEFPGGSSETIHSLLSLGQFGHLIFLLQCIWSYFMYFMIPAQPQFCLFLKVLHLAVPRILL